MATTTTTTTARAATKSTSSTSSTIEPKQQQVPEGAKKTSVSAAMSRPKGASKKPFGHLLPSGIGSPTDKMMSPATRGVESIRHKALKDLPPPQRLFEKFEAIKQQEQNQQLDKQAEFGEL
ncbi:hypothetical protein GGI12_001417 [Dipsacomyces acuminosporus]|nr:hypothetical protein GGI12_001417 [Dipsacomyces acuminosporus]